MPKIPLKVHSRWPIPQRYMQVKGPSIGRITESYNPLMEHPDGRYESSEYSLREGKSVPTEYLPLQGPWLPDEVERPRQAVKRFQEEYEDAMRDLREIDAYNRRVLAWDRYRQLPRRERQFWANRDKLARALEDYDVPQDPNWYTENYENFEYVPTRPRPRDVDFGQGMSINPEDYPEFPSFDEFPDYLVDFPWRR